MIEGPDLSATLGENFKSLGVIMSRNSIENINQPLGFSLGKTPSTPLGLLGRIGPKKIRTKIILLFTLLVLAISAFTLMYFPGRLTRRLTMDAQNRVESVSQLIVLAVSPGFSTKDEATLGRELRSACENSQEIVYAVLQTNAGRVTAAVNRDRAEEAGFRTSDPEEFSPAFKKLYRIHVPVVSGGKKSGSLSLGFSFSDLFAQGRSEKGIVVLASAGILGAGVFLVFLIGSIITRPLTQMTRTAERIAKGDLKQRARISSRDEVGLLARSFNTMVDGLEKAYKEQAKLNRSLEERVMTRASDLEREISERRRIEKELRLAKNELEHRVEKRTEELSQVNDDLHGKVLETRRAEDQLQSTLERLEKALEGTVRAMSLTIEMRDLYTAGHQRRVSDLAVAIAQEMHLPWEKIEGIRLSGVIHDIGKIAMPAEILTKPTRLTKTEFQLIKDHPRIGYDILKSIEFPWPVAHIILQHHERMDGSGYPDGLVGDAILLEARILAVADVVEALSSHRPYRPALGLEKALEEIRRGRGIRYDMKVVDACLKLFKENRYQLRTEHDAAVFQ
jgi:HD-GYP domain-containing protein (c-di-GMP phosphodiesterase class II)